MTVRRQRAFWIVLVVCALAGASLVLYATDLGVGVSPDSTVYINIARSWLTRFGYPLFAGNTSNLQPPGYPILLASGGYLLRGLDPFVAARWLDALLFVLNIACVGIILRLALPRSFWIPLLGMWLMLTSVNMLAIHTMAWSEPPFLFFSLVGLTLLAIYLERPRAWVLVLGSGCIAASLLTRYVGVALVATGAVALFLWSSRGWWQRARAAAVFVILACTPLIGWSLTHASDRELGWHVTPPEWFISGFSAVGNWVLPAEIPLVPIGIAFLAIGLVCIGTALALAKNQTGTRPTTGDEITVSRIPLIGKLLMLYVLCYVLVMLITNIFVDASVPLDLRLLGPIFPAVLIGVLYQAQRLTFSRTQIQNLKIACGGIAAVWSILYLVAGIIWVQQSHLEGQWYSSLAWEQSEIMRQVRALPPDTAIISNGNDAISFLTSRHASRLPDKVRADTTRPNPEYASDMAEVDTRLLGNTVIVYLNGFQDRWYLPSEQELAVRWNLIPIVRAADGTIYRRVP